MASQKKTFFLTPTWDYHPTGPVQLGNIILSPSNPAEALNGPHREAPVPKTLFPVTTKTDVTWCEEVSRSGSYGLWGEFLSFLGLDFVFAFRLRRIAVHSSGEITHAEYTKGAMYDADRSGNTDSLLPFKVSGLASEDAGAEEFGMSFTKEIVDGDTECICISAV